MVSNREPRPHRLPEQDEADRCLTHTLATDTYQTWSTGSPAVESQIAGSMKVTMRDAVAASAGQVWPSPWKMPSR